MNNKQKKTYDLIFEDPVRSDVPWSDIETLIIALGGEISQGNGSRIRVYLNGIRAVFHRPHPEKEADKGALRSIRRFLAEAGINKDRKENEL